MIACFGGNNTSGEIDVASACNAHGGSGRMDFESETFVAHSLRGDGFDASEDGTGRGTPLCVSLRGRDGGGTAELGGDVATALRASTGGGDKAHVLSRMAVRRLTPTECEALQGFPRNYTLIPRGKEGKLAADGPRYKAIGNSWPVPVITWLGSRIQQVDDIVTREDRVQSKAIERAA